MFGRTTIRLGIGPHSSYWCRNAVYSATNFTVGLSNAHPLAVKPVLGNYVVCGHYLGTVDAGTEVGIECTDDPPSTRYVIVQVASTDAISLSLCEVEVYSSTGQAARFLRY